MIAKQQYRAALSELLKSVELDSTNARSHYHLGFVYLHGFNRLEQAEQCLRTALSVSKTAYSEANNLLGLILTRQGRYPEAISQFETAMANILYPTPQFAEQNLAQTLILMGKKGEGVRRLKVLVRRVPNLCGAYQSLLDVGLRDGDANLLALYDPLFMKHCVRPSQVAERLDAAVRRAAYRRGVARARRRADAKAAFALATECRARVPRTVGDSGKACPIVRAPKPDPGFGGD